MTNNTVYIPRISKFVTKQQLIEEFSCYFATILRVDFIPIYKNNKKSAFIHFDKIPIDIITAFQQNLPYKHIIYGTNKYLLILPYNNNKINKLENTINYLNNIINEFILIKINNIENKLLQLTQSQPLYEEDPYLKYLDEKLEEVFYNTQKYVEHDDTNNLQTFLSPSISTFEDPYLKYLDEKLEQSFYNTQQYVEHDDTNNLQTFYGDYNIPSTEQTLKRSVELDYDYNNNDDYVDYNANSVIYNFHLRNLFSNKLQKIHNDLYNNPNKLIKLYTQFSMARPKK